MTEYTRNESVKEIARLCERYFESLESGAKADSVAECFRSEYLPLALQKIEEEPHNAFLPGFLAVGYHFFSNDEERSFELAEHYYLEAVKLEKQYSGDGDHYDYMTCGEPGLAFLYWEYGKIEDARKIWTQINTGWSFGVTQWWWRDVVMLPVMFDDVVPQTDIPIVFTSFAWAHWRHDEEWPHQEFVLLLHGFNQMIDRWDAYEYQLKSDVLMNLLATYTWYLDWNSRSFKGSKPEFVLQEVETLRERIDHLEAASEGVTIALEQLEGRVFRILRLALAKTEYQLALAREEYKFITDKQEIRLLEVMLETERVNPEPGRWCNQMLFNYGDEPLRVLFDFRPSLLKERQVLKALQGLYDIELEHCVESKPSPWLSCYIGEICRQIGRYPDAEKYLEYAYTFLDKQVDVIRSYGLSLASNKKLTEAVKVLQEITNPTHYDSEYIELLNANRGPTQQVNLNVYSLAGPSKTIYELLERIDVPHLTDVTAVDQELRVEEESLRFSDRVGKVVVRFSSEFDSKRLECAAEFATVWDFFPKNLQDEIISASIFFDCLNRGGSDNCSGGVLLFGTLCERALRLSFAKYLADYLEVKNISRLNIKNGSPLIKKKDNEDWSDVFEDARFVDIQAAIRMGKEKGHPVVGFMTEMSIDRWTWSVKLYGLIDRVRILRNEAAHKPTRDFTVTELREVRSILWTQGLLYETGELLCLCAGK